MVKHIKLPFGYKLSYGIANVKNIKEVTFTNEGSEVVQSQINCSFISLNRNSTNRFMYKYGYTYNSNKL